MHRSEPGPAVSITGTGNGNVARREIVVFPAPSSGPAGAPGTSGKKVEERAAGIGAAAHALAALLLAPAPRP